MTPIIQAVLEQIMLKEPSIQCQYADHEALGFLTYHHNYAVMFRESQVKLVIRSNWDNEIVTRQTLDLQNPKTDIVATFLHHYKHNG